MEELNVNIPFDTNLLGSGWPARLPSAHCARPKLVLSGSRRIAANLHLHSTKNSTFYFRPSKFYHPQEGNDDTLLGKFYAAYPKIHDIGSFDDVAAQSLVCGADNEDVFIALNMNKRYMMFQVKVRKPIWV